MFLPSLKNFLILCNLNRFCMNLNPTSPALFRPVLGVFLLFCVSMVASQSTYMYTNDSIYQAFHTSKPGSDNYHKSLFKIVDMGRSNQPDSTIKYCELSLKHNPGKKQPYYFQALFMKADVFSIRGQFKYADSLFLAAEYLIPQIKDSLLVADYYNCRGINYIEMGEAEKSIRDFKLSYEYIKYSHPKDASKCIGNIASIFSDHDQEDSCLYYNLIALDMRLALKDTNGIETSLSNIGTVYFKKGMFRQCIDHTHAADEFRRLPPYKVCAIAVNMVNAYKRIGKKDSAFYWVGRHYKAAETMNSEGQLAKAHFLKAELFSYYEQFDSSLYYMLIALPVLEANNDTVGNRTRYYELGHTYLELKRYAEAEKYLDIAYRYMVQFNDPNQQLGTMRLLGQARLGRAGREDLIDWYIRTENFADSLNEQKLRSIEHELLIQYETEKTRSALLSSEVALQQSKIEVSRQRAIIIVLLVLGALAVLLSIVFRRLARYKKLKQDGELRNKENEAGMRIMINAEEKERQRIARELHDGLGQRLGLIQIKLEALQDEISKETTEVVAQMQAIGTDLKGVSNEVRDISHAMMPAILTHGSLIDALNGLMQSDYGGIPIVWEFENLLPETFTIPREMQHGLYRITQEAIYNSIKHGKAGHISVALRQMNGYLSLMIEDNGVGFNLSTIKPGLGLSNIRQRIMALGGTVDIESSPDKGCIIRLRVPLEKNEN